MTRTPPGASARPLLKWPGGKEGELRHILPCLPESPKRVFEPFVGGGAVFLANLQLPALINDRSADLVALYRAVGAQDAAVFGLLEAFDVAWCAVEALLARHGALFAGVRADDARIVAALVTGEAAAWDAIAGNLPEGEGFATLAARTLTAKLTRMARLEAKRGTLSAEDAAGNVEGALKGALYLHARARYNARVRDDVHDAVRTACFYVLREYGYAAMFRTNRQGLSNVPFGGMTYAPKRLAPKIAAMRAPQVVDALARATVTNLDFEAFLAAHPPVPGDFVFCDPPYDSAFSTYDRAAFTADDQRRLRRVVGALAPGVAAMLVVKATPLVRELYEGGGFHVRCFDKTYLWTIKERNDRAAQHLLVTNYPVAPASPAR